MAPPTFAALPANLRPALLLDTTGGRYERLDMTLPEYMADIAREMADKSESIRRDFAHHHPSAGEHREDLVRDFLQGHLPKRFEVSSGFAISIKDMFSSEADLLVVDHQNNAPLYRNNRKCLWPIESIYALVEVKTSLNLTDLKDAISKGRKFKSLQRQFCDVPNPPQRIDDSLFVIWAFKAPCATTLKSNLMEQLSDVPVNEQPDFIIVPNRLVVQSGSYMELAKLGQPNSNYRRKLESRCGQELSGILPEPVQVDECKENSLFVWYTWFDSWLRRAGDRFTDPILYLPPDKVWGRRV